VRKIVLEELKPYADEVRVDALGSVLATKFGRVRNENRLRVMLDAHMDEVGFMIVADEGEGLYRFETIGGIDVRHLVGKQVLVGKERTPAVIGGKPIHLMSADERTRKVPLESLRLDMGLSGKASVGDYAGFATQFRRAGPSILSKSIDDRIGVATLIELLRQAPPNIDLCLAFSVQEEIGLRGAKVAAQYFHPDLAIAVDSTPAYDLPLYEDGENISYNTKLGLGPAIYIADGSTLHDPRLVRFLQETAEAEKIPYQFRQPGGGGTDSGAIQRSLAGIPTVSISVPHRYTHSPVSIARVEDWKNTINLLQASLKKITPALISQR
jgi:endoglucanase